MMKLFGFIAVAAMSLTACQNDIDEQVNVNNEGVTLEVVADMGTRSYFGEKEDAGYPSTWTGNEKVQFAANDGDGFTVTNTESGATTHLSATFTTGTTTNDGVIFAMSPVGDYKNGKGGWGSYSWSYGNVYLTIPAVQTPIEQSVDEAAHILFAEHNYEGAFPTGTIGMEFKHALAYGKMTLTLPEGVEASQVILHFPVAVAGNSVKRYIKEYTDDEKTYQPGEFTGADQKTITLNAGNVVDGVYWFGLLPIGLVTEDMNIEVVATNGDIYKKTIAVGGDLEFNQGRVSAFKVTMAACTPEVTNNFVDNAYNLVTSINDLAIGDKVVFVAHKYNKAMGAQNSNNRASVAVVKDTENNTVDFDSKVTIFTVEAGKTAGNFAFKTNGKYIYAAGSTANNYLREEGTLSTNSSWVVSIATNGVATIKAENTATTRNWFRYNNDSDLFSCYTSGQADVCIYKLVGEYTPADPAIEITIADYSLAYDATSGSATMTTQYATGWSFNATTDAAWISNITVASNAVTFNSEANESEEDRSATITVVASREGYSDVTKTFTVSQAGKPSGDITKGATYSYTFTAKQFSANGTKKLGTLNWTLAGNGGYWGYDTNSTDKGQQFGSSGKPYKTMTLKTTGYEGGVKTIKINTSGASSVSAKLTVTVGGKQIGSTVSISSSKKDYTFESTDMLLSGDIVLTYTQTSSKAIYIKSIAIN